MRVAMRSMGQRFVRVWAIGAAVWGLGVPACGDDGNGGTDASDSRADSSGDTADATSVDVGHDGGDSADATGATDATADSDDATVTSDAADVDDATDATGATDVTDATDDTDATVPDGDTVVTNPLTIDWCRLQFPLDVSIGNATPFTAYGRVHIAGVTDVSDGVDADARIVARLGRGPDGTSPSTWSDWGLAAPTPAWSASGAGEPGNDEYRATLPALAATGQFDFAFAFSGDGGATWTYCDRDEGDGHDGAEDGYEPASAGQMTVVANPCQTNPCTSPPAHCDGAVLTTYASPGTCRDDGGAAACDYATPITDDCAASGKACDPVSKSCKANPCDPNPCTTGAAGTCDGDVAVASATVGTCDTSSGTVVCDYPAGDRTDCSLSALPFCHDGACVAWRPAGVGDLVISEVMPNPKAVDDAVGEWFELASVSDDAVNLQGLTIDGNTASEHFAVDGELVVDPGRRRGLRALGRPRAERRRAGRLRLRRRHARQRQRHAQRLARRRARRHRGVEQRLAFRRRRRRHDLAPTSADSAANDLPAAWCKAYTTFGDGDRGSPGAANDACVEPIAWCRLQFPAAVSIAPGGSFDAYGHVDVPGLTDLDTGPNPHPLVRAQLGRGATGSAPSTWTTWSDAALNEAFDASGEPANDEYVATLGVGNALGAQDFAYRFSGDAGLSWTYCDLDAGDGLDGSEDGYSADHAGKLTVTNGPCVPNPCTEPPSACEGATLRVFPATGTCTPNGAVADCSYTPTSTTDCAASGKFCDAASASCIADPCTPNPCTVGKPATCDGNDAVTYVATGTCSTADGATACAYPEATRTTCQGATPFCRAGACSEWRPAGVGDLVISEVMGNPNAVDDAVGEWFEVSNIAAVAVNLNGLKLQDTSTTSTTVATDVIVPPGGAALFVRTAASATNGGLTADATFGFSLNNSGGDAITITRGADVIDKVDFGPAGLNLAFPTGASLQLSPNRFSADADDVPASWCVGTESYGNADRGSPKTANHACLVDIDWCRLQAPESASLAAGGSVTVYGRVYVAGITDVDQTGNDASASIQAAIGVGPSAGAFDPSAWTWTPAAPNAGYGTGSPAFEAHNDEYQASLAAPATAGSYRYAFRFSGDHGASWSYCDLNRGAGHDGIEDGFDPADAGALTVTSPCDPNPCTAPAAPRCDAGSYVTQAATGACTVQADGAHCAYAETPLDCGALGKQCDAGLGCVDCLGDGDCDPVFERCDTGACVPFCRGDNFEPNDVFASAKPITGNVGGEGLTFCPGDADYFAIDAGTRRIEAAITFGGGPTYALKLYDAAKNLLATGVAAGGGLAIDYTPPTNLGPYVLEVTAPSGYGIYNLWVTFIRDVCNPNPCTTPPAATCSGTHAISYPATGACSDSGGGAHTCDYATGATDTACPAFCQAGACTDWRYPGVAGDLVVSELSPHPVAPAGAYLEVYNASGTRLNLRGLSVTAMTGAFVVAEDLFVAAGDYLVFGASADLGVSGGPAVDYVWSGFALVDGNDDLVLEDADGGLLDEVAYDASFPYALGVAASFSPELVGDADAAAANDVAANWCAAKSNISAGVRGTPGAANDSCAEVDFCRLQYPLSASLGSNATTTVYGRLYIAGVTDQNTNGNDPRATIVGRVGIGPTGSDPTGPGWTWTAAAPNPSYVVTGNPVPEPNNDEYVATLTAPALSGSYDYAFAFSADGGATYLVCDSDGTRADGGLGYDSAQAGKLTVTTPLMMTEYVEGSSNNKAIEVTNTGSATLDLAASACQLRFYSTATTHGTPTTTIALSGTVAAGASWVVCDSGSAAGLLAVCNQPSSASFFNGDDPVELRCNAVSLDWIGQTGAQVTFAQDVTLHRKCSVTAGDAVGSDVFDRTVGWDVLPKDTFVGLGKPGPAAPATVTGKAGKPLVIESYDVGSGPDRVRLRNVSAAAVTITASWRWCYGSGSCEAVVAADTTIAAGAVADFALGAAADRHASDSFDLGLFASANTGVSDDLAAYLAVGAGAHSQEALAVAAGLWVAGQGVTLGASDGGLVLTTNAVIGSAAAYTAFANACHL
ncbi:MAG: lamin tail domain-containing protein [Myxococcota bacterium]